MRGCETVSIRHQGQRMDNPSNIEKEYVSGMYAMYLSIHSILTVYSR